MCESVHSAAKGAELPHTQAEGEERGQPKREKKLLSECAARNCLGTRTSFATLCSDCSVALLWLHGRLQAKAVATQARSVGEVQVSAQLLREQHSGGS